MLCRMTVYVYGGNLQENKLEVRQVTIPQSTIGFQLKRQLLRNHTDTNYILLYNNRRIDGEMLLYQQIPNFASIILCALGKGGGKDNEDNVSSKKAMFDSLNSCYLSSCYLSSCYLILQMNVQYILW